MDTVETPGGGNTPPDWQTVRSQEVKFVALTLESKKALVAEVSEIAAKAHSAVAAEYRGLTVEQMNVLRAQAREAGVYLRVVKNNLARRAIKGTDFECMADSLVGPLLLAFSQEDPGSAARVVKKFAKEHDKLQAKIVAIGGQAMPGTELDRLASLPTRDEAISLLMAVMKAPIEKFVRTLNEPHAKLVRTIAAVRDQKQAA
jgi:large subunit ribosomal protein L10